MDLRRGKQRKPLILAIFRGHLEEHAVMAWVEVHQREEETEGRAQVHPIWFTHGNYSKQAAVALPGSFDRSPPAVFGSHFGPISLIAVEPLPKKNCSGGPVPTLVPLCRAR